LAKKTEMLFVCLWIVTAKNIIIFSVMNSIILILHLLFFIFNRNILGFLGFIFNIIPLYNCPAFAFMYIYWKLLLPACRIAGSENSRYVSY